MVLCESQMWEIETFGRVDSPFDKSPASVLWGSSLLARRWFARWINGDHGRQRVPVRLHDTSPVDRLHSTGSLARWVARSS